MVDPSSPPKRSGDSVARSTGRSLDQRGSLFEDFYPSDYRAVLVLARVLTGDPHAAQDVAHDAFAAAWKDWDRLDNPPAWVRRVVSNKAKSRWRRMYAERRAMTFLATEAPQDPEMPAETEAFWAQVRRLPARQAQTVTLFYLEDLSTAEIADVLGCAPATVRVHLTRGRRTLAARLEMSDDDRPRRCGPTPRLGRATAYADAPRPPVDSLRPHRPGAALAVLGGVLVAVLIVAVGFVSLNRPPRWLRLPRTRARPHQIRARQPQREPDHASRCAGRDCGRHRAG